MKIVRIYTGEDGESHFEDRDISLDNPVDSDLRSELIKATGIIFRETGSDYDLDFHNAPRRQFMINLEGSVEIITGDGSSRILGPGVSEFALCSVSAFSFLQKLFSPVGENTRRSQCDEVLFFSVRHW